MKIAVLYGGLSSEREVSLRSGEAIFQALLSKGYDAEKIDVDRDVWEKLKQGRFDLAFLGLHGRYGEDGTIQGMLEIMGLPYTGSGVLASSLAMDKIMTKKVLVTEEIPTAKFLYVSQKELINNDFSNLAAQILAKMPVPLVVKAATQGSTIGIYFVHHQEDLPKALEDAFKYDREVLIEEFIMGVEVTAAVLGNYEPQVLPLIEITTTTGIYDYNTKYTPGLSDHLIPPRIPQDLQDQISQWALKTYLALGCRGLARVDFIIDEKSGVPLVLEANTLPGMTDVSLYPDAARAAGIDFPQLVDRIVKLALEK